MSPDGNGNVDEIMIARTYSVRVFLKDLDTVQRLDDFEFIMNRLAVREHVVGHPQRQQTAVDGVWTVV
jgi:hypothetical protein